MNRAATRFFPPSKSVFPRSKFGAKKGRSESGEDERLDSVGRPCKALFLDEKGLDFGLYDGVAGRGGEGDGDKKAFLPLLNGLKCAWVHEMERRLRNNFPHLDLGYFV